MFLKTSLQVKKAIGIYFEGWCDLFDGVFSAEFVEAGVDQREQDEQPAGALVVLIE